MSKRRGIATAKGAIKERLKYDRDFLIKGTDFIVITTMKNSVNRTYDIDPNKANSVIERLSDGKTFNREHFMITSMDFYKIVYTLSPKAYLLLEWIIDNIAYNSNHIILDGKKICEIIKDKYLSNASKYLIELKNKDLVHKSIDEDNKNVYVINHNKFFKGNYNQFIYRYNKIYNEPYNKLTINDTTDAEEEERTCNCN